MCKVKILLFEKSQRFGFAQAGADRCASQENNLLCGGWIACCSHAPSSSGAPSGPGPLAHRNSNLLWRQCRILRYCRQYRAVRDAVACCDLSEGLRVIVLECRSFGGQAGASARIENYLGFPTGISGQALAGRAYVQAQKFGAEMLIPAQAGSLDCSKMGRNGEMTLKLTDGRALRSRTVVIASGAQYRRPAVPRLAEFEGRGIWYWASALEAKLCAGEEVALVGGGNSAGQAAVFLANHASRVHMLIRGEGLAATMSRYLIDRIAATPSIEFHPSTEVTQLCGDAEGRLASTSWRDRRTGVETTHEVRHLFVFVGADPETEWLGGCGVVLDAHGFVVTGAPVQTADGRAPGALESSVPGVYAVGDVRSDR
jgi:thioredoxin reductase (NADPH)